MDEYESLSHTRWDCKYHVVFIPKCRRKALYGELRRHLGEVFKKLTAASARHGHERESARAVVLPTTNLQIALGLVVQADAAP